MEVAEASGLASDARLLTSTNSPDVRSGTHGGSKVALKEEPLPRATNNEEPVDARLTTSDSNEATEEKCEETARSSSRADDANGPRVLQTPLAFTIDFGSNKEVDTARYQNLFERYNARHKRNLSTSKVLKILSFFYYMSCRNRYMCNILC